MLGMQRKPHFRVGDFYCPTCNAVYQKTFEREHPFVQWSNDRQACCGVCGRVLQIVTNIIPKGVEVAEMDELAIKS
jgi:transcription elongation factor Elf1